MVVLPQLGMPTRLMLAFSAKMALASGAMRSVWGWVPVKRAAAYTAWATSISRPPAALAPAARPACTSRVEKGL